GHGSWPAYSGPGCASVAAAPADTLGQGGWWVRRESTALASAPARGLTTPAVSRHRTDWRTCAARSRPFRPAPTPRRSTVDPRDYRYRTNPDAVYGPWRPRRSRRGRTPGETLAAPRRYAAHSSAAFAAIDPHHRAAADRSPARSNDRRNATGWFYRCHWDR